MLHDYSPARKLRRFVFGLLALGTSLVAQAAPAADEARVLAALKKAHPSTQFTEVRRTPLAGLYEAWMGRGNMAFVLEKDTRYLLFGRLFDTRTMTDLTAARLPASATAAAAPVTMPGVEPRIRFDQLPLADAITTVRGSGRRHVAVFSDPGCPFCRRLEPELEGINDVTIHTFLVPYQGAELPLAIWCAPDRSEAWRRTMLEGNSPPPVAAAARCANPIERNLELAQQLGVEGTPTLFWADGTRTTGYASRAVLEERLASAAGASR